MIATAAQRGKGKGKRTITRRAADLPSSSPGRALTVTNHIVEQARFICTEFGPDRKGLAKALGITSQRLSSWMNDLHFKRAVEQGMDAFHSGKVEGSLLRRALGYEYVEVQERETTVMGTNALGMKVQVPAMQRTETTKHVQPDTGAIIFYLTNRLPERWRQTFRTESKTDVTTTHNQNMTVDLGNLEREDLETLRDILQRARSIDAEARPADAGRGNLARPAGSRIAQTLPA